MSKKIIVTPPAGSMIHSLRSIGYDLKSAVADIIDNSIAAGAKNINVVLEIAPDITPYLFILDDGSGMNYDELVVAMTPGSKSPVDVRNLDDLGRFGMGLKTASFSQCLELTVVTRDDVSLVGARWSLENVASTNEWGLELLNNEQCLILLSSLKVNIKHKGTLVLWNKCDELIEGINDDDVLSSIIGEHVNDLREHLSLVFHKYLDRKVSRININLNSLRLTAKDPFCITGKFDTPISSISLTDTINVDAHSNVTIKGYMLPHPTKLNSSQINFTSPNSDYFNSQGFYIYRADRLISWGSWFRLAKKSQSNKLARVEVCIPNSVDAQWKLDIKKICDIKPESFSPKPKIDSSLLFFTPKQNFYKIKDPKNLEKITRIFFSQRRKMLKKPFNQLFNGDKKILDSLKIDLNLRPQNLDFDTYYKLTIEYEKLRS